MALRQTYFDSFGKVKKLFFSNEERCIRTNVMFYSYVKANFLYHLDNVDLTNDIKIIEFTPLSPVSFVVICLFSEYNTMFSWLVITILEIYYG